MSSGGSMVGERSGNSGGNGRTGGGTFLYSSSVVVVFLLPIVGFVFLRDTKARQDQIRNRRGEQLHGPWSSILRLGHLLCLPFILILQCLYAVLATPAISTILFFSEHRANSLLRQAREVRTVLDQALLQDDAEGARQALTRLYRIMRHGRLGPATPTSTASIPPR